MLLHFPILLLMFIGLMLLSAWFLMIAARWLKASKATFVRAVSIVLVMNLVGIAVVVGFYRLADALGDERSGLLSLASLGVSIVVVLAYWMVIGATLGVSFGRAIVIWAIHAGVSCAIAIGLVFLLKAHVMNAYVQTSNSMAPTFVGWHRGEVCPHCQGKLVVPATEPGSMRFREDPDWDRFGICTDCRKTHKLKTGTSPVLTPDRMFVSYLHKPERWDTIVFRYPREPTNKWVFRLVGLPGETVYIKDGAIWINDVKQENRPELAGLRYTAVIGGDIRDGRGTPEDPFKLGPNECCVLGDFPESSADSRDWGPLPMENIEGVVCAVYWPASRWKILR